MDNILKKIKEKNSSIGDNDKALSEEMKSKRNDSTITESALEGMGGTDSLNIVDTEFALETIVLRQGRPVLSIYQGDTVLNFRDVASEVWRERLTNSRQQLISAIKSVGRIELKYDPTFDWIGTGWLVDEDIVVTNRHVAEVFGRSNGVDFVFKQGIGGKEVESYIDLLEEADNIADFTFKIKRILHIEPWPGPDMALLLVETQSTQDLPEPILLADFESQNLTQVATIGYPARDSRIPEQDLMLQIFGDVYNKKKLAPGQIINVTENELLHDCSTLGGNSGSVVLDLNSGKALGLHFAGRFLQGNSAVPAAIIKQRVDRIKSNKRPVSSNQQPKSENQAQTSVVVNTDTGISSMTIPLEITVTIGQPKSKL